MAQAFTFSNELQLLVLLCKVYLGHASLKKAEQFIFDNAINWEMMPQWIRVHRLGPITYPLLKQLQPHMPDDAWVKIEAQYQRSKQRTLQMVAQLAVISRLFSENNIHMVALKGPVLSQQLYGDVAMRRSYDLDILVSPDDIYKAHTLLLEAGYQGTGFQPGHGKVKEKVYFSVGRHLSYKHDKLPVNIELHWRIADMKALSKITLQNSLTKNSTEKIAGLVINRFSDEDTFLYLCLHGAKDIWTRFQWLMDIAALLRKNLDITYIKSQSAAWQLERPVAQAMKLSQMILGTDLPHELTEWVSDMPLPARLIKMPLRKMAEPKEMVNKEEGLSQLKRALYYYYLHHGLRYRIGLFTRLLTIPRDWDVIRLPDWLFFLYYPLRPFLWIYKHHLPSFLKEEKRRMPVYRTFFRFLQQLWQFSKIKFSANILLLILLGCLQGIGILLLIPMLSLVGIGGVNADTGNLASAIVTIFKSLWVPLNLLNVLFVYVLVLTLFALIRYVQSVLSVHITHNFIRHLQSKLYEALIHAQWAYVVKQKSAHIANTIIGEVGRTRAVTGLLIQNLSSAIIAAMYVIVSFSLSVPLTLLALSGLLLLVFFQRPINKKALNTGITAHSNRQDIFSEVSELLTGFKLAKSFNAQHRHLKRFTELAHAHEKNTIRFMKARSATQFIFTIGTAFFISGYFYVAFQIANIPVAELLVLLFILARLQPIASSMHGNYQHIINMLPAINTIDSFVKDCDNAREAVIITGDNSLLPLKKEILLKNVSFRYDKSSESVLKNVSIAIPVKKTTAISGASGKGKSTFVDLIMGLLIPSEGTIYVDEIPLTQQKIPLWRNGIGYVPQETFLFHDTVRNNLAWAKPDAGEEEMWDALQMASAEDFVRKTQNGLDTVVGDRGLRLSGGECQRIALARAILRKPQLLVLDEATSALDKENEQFILEGLRKIHGKFTVIIVSHRPSAQEFADFVLEISNKRVTEKYKKATFA